MLTWTSVREQVVGARTFYIECLYRDEKDPRVVPEAHYWVVSEFDHARRAPSPFAELYRNPATGLMFNYFYASDDEYTILVDQKIAHGTNQMRVLHRVKGLHYRFAEKLSLNERVAKQFGSVPKWEGWDASAPYVDIIRFDRWLPNRRHALLACLYNNFGDSSRKTIYYNVTLDTHTGRLSDHRHVPGQDLKRTFS